jgi:uncharacterized protein YecE (DUF72 family)
MLDQQNPLFLSGTSGLALTISQAQYPAAYKGASRLTYYGSLYNSIEINSIFYKLPKGATIRKWSESVPPHFRFTFKLSKSITHSKDLAFASSDVIAFMNVVGHVDEKKGCLLIQFPPSLKHDHLDQVEDLLLQLKAADPKGEWKLAVEFRNRSWYSEATYSFLQKYGVTLVQHDFPSSATPEMFITGNCVYMRFHGPDGKYKGSYTDEALLATSRQIKMYIAEGKQVYVYFNNTMGDAAHNLQTLNGLVKL